MSHMLDPLMEVEVRLKVVACGAWRGFDGDVIEMSA